MKISYTGRHEEFPAKERAKLEQKLQKLSKMVDRKSEREAHVILSQERFLHKVEITVNAWGHALVGVGSSRDLVTAAHDAVEKLEKRILKVRQKFRDTSRHKGNLAGLPEKVEQPAVARSKKAKTVSAPAGRSPRKVFRVNHRDGSKPRTLEEAMLEMEVSQDYMVYKDAGTDRVTVLVRRPDGHFDLIES